MGRLGGVVVALLLGLAAPAQAQTEAVFNCEDIGGSKVTKRGSFEALPQEVVEVPSKLDGRAQQVGFIRPKAPAGYKAPVIVHASPYHAKDLKEADLTQCARFLTANFVQHGYAVALVPVRGGGDTDGCANMFGKIERSDLDDVLTWLGTRSWSNGRIGMWGISYSGSTPYVAAASGNPYLKTIVPGAGVHDLFDLAFSGGTLDSRAELFAPLYYLEYGPMLNNPVTSGRDPQRTINAVADCPDLVQGIQAGRESSMTGARDAAGYWAERDQRELVLDNYRGSVLIVQGLTDWNVRPQHSLRWGQRLRRSGLRVHMLLGQWNHQWPDMEGNLHARWDWADRLLAWFDHELKRKGGSLGPRVEVEDDSGQWRRARSWPPNNNTTLHLTADGRLAPAPDAVEATTTLASDSRSRFYYAAQDFPSNNTESEAALPSAVDELCATCAAFTLPVQKRLRIAGQPAVTVSVTPQGPSGHVTAFLYRREADGLHRVGWGMTDLRFPAGENAGDETADPVTPGVPLDVRIDLEPLDAVVDPGEALVLILGQGRTSQVVQQVPIPVTLTHGGGKGSMSFAVHQPRKRAFFTPPGPEGRQLP